jgi:hypothetical protein
MIFRDEIDVLFPVTGDVKFPLAEINVIPGRVGDFLFAAPRVKEKEVTELFVSVHDLEELRSVG